MGAEGVDTSVLLVVGVRREYVGEVGGDEGPPLLPAHVAPLYPVQQRGVQNIDVVDCLEEDVEAGDPAVRGQVGNAGLQLQEPAVVLIVAQLAAVHALQPASHAVQLVVAQYNHSVLIKVLAGR